MSAVRQVGIKMVVDAQSVTTELPRAAREFVNLGASAEQGATRATRSLAQVSMSVRDIVQGAAGLHIVSNGIEAISNALTALPRNAFDYSKNLEVSQVGMAGILGSMTAINGQQLDYNRSLQLAVQYIQQLNDDALRTAATSQELVQVFQALLAPGLGARMTLDEIRQLTVVGTNAVKSMGLDASQVVQELRDLVAGGIQPASSTFANALGLKDSDIAKAKASSEGLFKFLMDRMQGFKASSEAFSETFKGKLDQIQEGATRVAAQGMEPLIVASKAALDDVSRLFVTIDANQKVTLNNDLVNSIKNLSEVAVNGMGALRELGVGLYEHREAVTMLAAAYMGLKLGNFVADLAQATAAKVEAAQASRLAAVQSAAESVGNVEVAVTSKQKLAAYMAELSAKAAQAQADVAAQAAQIATLNTTREAIVVARAEVVAKMDAVRVTMAQAEAQIAAARAAGAQSIALAAVREGTQALTAAQARHAVLMTELATLGKQQASVQAAIAAATSAQTAAQSAASASAAQLAAAQGAASVAGRALSGAVGFLGGPLGILTTAVTLGATAWALWGSNGSNAERQVQGAVARTTPEIIADLDKQIEKLQQRNALAAAGMGDLAKQSGEATDRLAELQAQIDNLQAGKGPTGGQGLPEEARRELLQKLLVQYGTLAGKIRTAEEAQASLTAGAGKLGLTVQGAEQAWRKANDGVKTAIAIQQEYSDKLSASRSAWEQYRTALEQQGTDPEKIRQAQAEQDQVERQLAAERDKKIKDLGASAATARAQGIDAEIAATKQGYKLLAAQTADSLAEVDALRKRGAIDESEALERRTALQLADIDAQRAALQAELVLMQGRKDSAKEQANIQGELIELAQKRANVEAQASRQQQELDAQAADALDQRIKAQQDAAAQAQQNLRVAQLDQQEIGKTGEALGALRQARVEETATALESQAVTWAGIDQSGQMSEALRAQAKAVRALAKVQGESRAMQMAYEYKRGIEESNRLLQAEIGLMGLSGQARELALEQLRIQLDLEKKIAEVKTNMRDTPERAQVIADLEASAAIANANAASRVFLQEWKESVKQYDDIFRRGFADMLNNGEAGWDSFTKSLVTTFKTTVADQIYKAFAQPIVVNVVGNLMGFLGQSGMSALGGGGAAGSAMSMLSLGKDLYGAITGGFSALSGQVASWVQSGMNWLSGSGGMISQGPIQVGGTAAGIGTAAGYAAGALGGIYGGRMISGGYSAVGNSGNTAVNAGTAIGAIWGPVGALVGGLIGGAVNRLFGRKLKDSGIEGEFGGERGFEGRAFEYYKGGLFRGNKTKYRDLDEEVRAALADQFTAMRDGAKGMAEVLGLGTSAIDDFTASIKVSLHGLSAEDADKKLKEEFDKIAESLASTTLGTDEYSRAGETALETLSRLSGSLVGVNTVFDQLGYTLLEASLAGADAASRLADRFGGMEGFNSATGAYFQNFYSGDERREAMRRQLDTELGKLDLELPDIDAKDARRQWRELVEAQDRNTEAGARNWAMLIQLAPAYAAITDEGTAAADELRSVADALGTITADNVKGLFDDVLKNAGSAEEARTMGAQGFEEMVMGAMLNGLVSNLSSIVMAQIVTPLITTASTQATLQTVGAAVSASTLAAGGALGGAANAAGGTIASQAMAEGGIVAANAMISGGAAVGQVVSAALDATRAQMAAVGEIMKDPGFRDLISQGADMFGEISADLFDFKGSLGSLGASMSSAGGAMASGAASAKTEWEGLADSLMEEVKRIRGEVASETTATGFAHAQAQYSIAVAQARAGDTDAAQSLPALSRAMLEAARGVMSSAADYRYFAASTAATLSEIATTRGGNVQRDKEREEAERKRILNQEDQARWLAAWQAAGEPAYFEWDGEKLRTHWELPAYANGGHHSGGWAMVGERGPELAYMPPSRIYTADQTRSMQAALGMQPTGGLQGEQLAAVIDVLERRLAALQDELREIKGSTRRIDDVIDEFARRGMPVVNQPDTKLETT